jgi:hypothetical protein
MSRARVIVFDRRGVWAAALARHVPARAHVRQTRSLAECAAELAVAPASLLVVEAASASVTSVAAWLADMGRRFPLARAVVVGERALDPHEWLLREAGAVHFVTSPRELAGVKSLIQRHFERLPRAKVGLAQRVWESLPWDSAAPV